MIQANAIKSWTMLKPEPEILLLGNDPGVDDISDRLGCTHHQGLRVNEWGTPLVSDAFRLGQELAKGDIMCYVNSDVILMQQFLGALNLVCEQKERFLMLSQRWDWHKPSAVDFTPGWPMRTMDAAKANGRLHNPFGIDAFCFTRGVFDEMPPFAFFYAWDNWLILDALRRDVPIVDVSQHVMLIHQDHTEKMDMQARQSAGMNPQRLRNLELASDLVKIGSGPPGCVTASQFVLSTDGKVVPRKRAA
jgi:hypothetical protein